MIFVKIDQDLMMVHLELNHYNLNIIDHYYHSFINLIIILLILIIIFVKIQELQN